jgi:hypothetical protein
LQRRNGGGRVPNPIPLLLPPPRRVHYQGTKLRTQ